MRQLLISFALLLLANFLPAQTNYYVAPGGSNGNTGTTSLQAWETIQYGIDQLSPGDTLNVMSGSYNEKIKFNNSGTTQDRLVLRNNPGDIVYLFGTGLTATEPMIEITDRVGITVQGLIIHDNAMNDAQGILISGASTDITIAQNEIYDIHFSSNPNASVNATTNAQPIIVYGTDPNTPITNLLIEQNEVRDCRTGFSEAMAINGNVTGFEVAENQVHDITNIGIDLIGHEGTCSDPSQDQARYGRVHHNHVHHCLSSYATSGGIYVDGAAFCTIENNTCYRNGFGIEVGCENVGKSASNIRVRNNLLYDNEVAGLALGGFDFPSGSGRVEFIDVRNNTLLKNDFSGSFTGELYISYCDNCLLRNNIFFTSAQNTLAYGENVPTTFLMSFNISHCSAGASALEYDWNGNSYTGFSSFQSSTGQETNSFSVDPALNSANVLNADFHLQSNSPAIDAGDPSTASDSTDFDIDDVLRPVGTRIDIGADEYGGQVAVQGAPHRAVGRIFPNPVRGVLYLQGMQSYGSDLRYRIWDLSGRLVEEGEFARGGQRLKMREKGIFIFELMDREEVVLRKKLLVE